MRRAAAVTVVAFVVAAVALVFVRHEPSLAPVSAIDAWVPFQAEFRQVREGQVEAVGRYMRGRDGSARRETMAPDGGQRFITIVNVWAGRFYSFAGGTWTAQTLILRGVRTPRDTDAGARLVRVTDRVNGLHLVRETTPAGSVMLRAPALDLFAVLEQHPYPAMRREHFNIVIAPVSESLFAPPPGAAVADLPWPHVMD